MLLSELLFSDIELGTLIEESPGGRQGTIVHKKHSFGNDYLVVKWPNGAKVTRSFREWNQVEMAVCGMKADMKPDQPNPNRWPL